MCFYLLPLYLCVCIRVVRANKVFSRGGLYQSGEDGPVAILSQSVSLGERKQGRGEEGRL